MAVLLNILTLGETNEYYETAEKEAQDTSCRGSGGVPQLQKYPKTGAYRGLVKTISAVSLFNF